MSAYAIVGVRGCTWSTFDFFRVDGVVVDFVRVEGQRREAEESNS